MTIHYTSGINVESFEHKWDVQFRKGTLEMVILAVLSTRPKYGLEVLQSLHQLDSMKISEGTLYPLLDRLKRDDLIDSYWQQEEQQRPRKYYQITNIGRTKLHGLQQRWTKAASDIESIFETLKKHNDGSK